MPVAERVARVAVRLEDRDRRVRVEVVHDLHAPVVDVVEDVGQRQRRREEEDRVHRHDRRRSPSARAARGHVAQAPPGSPRTSTTSAPVNRYLQRRARCASAPATARPAGRPSSAGRSRVRRRREQARAVGRRSRRPAGCSSDDHAPAPRAPASRSVARSRGAAHRVARASARARRVASLQRTSAACSAAGSAETRSAYARARRSEPSK